jgi:hypothetical protein
MKGTAMVGYNVQTVVDAQHHLIVAHEVTNTGSDRAQLSKMALAARKATEVPNLQVLADRGYYSGPELKACEDAGITAYVPKSMTSSANADGRFDKGDVIYVASADEYQCPAGNRAIYRFTSEERGLQTRCYWSSACIGCAIKAQCTPSSYRRIRRWEHEEVVDAVQQRLEQRPDAMMLRKSTVEHVFGTLKHWMGWTHFLMRRKVNVATEMSLHVLAYNLKRVIRILGVANLINAMKLVGV